MKIKNNNM